MSYKDVKRPRYSCLAGNVVYAFVRFPSKIVVKGSISLEQTTRRMYHLHLITHAAQLNYYHSDLVAPDSPP